MDRIDFLDYASLGEYIYELASEKEKTVGVVLFKNEIVLLLQWLMEYGDIEVGHIDIKDEDIDEYDREYYLVLDEFLNLEITPVYNCDSNEIEYSYVDVLLLDGDVSSKIALANDGCDMLEISFNKKNDECGDCCCDCTNCNKAAVSQAIESALSFLDYLCNHND